MFVEDDILKTPLSLLKLFGCYLSDEEKDNLHNSDISKLLCIEDIHNILSENPVLEVYDSFKDALTRIVNLKKEELDDYRMFIFDRNLNSDLGYSQEEIVAICPLFREDDVGREGDFLAERLNAKGYPLDKVFFYSAYSNMNSQIDEKVDNETFHVDHFIDKSDPEAVERLVCIINDDPRATVLQQHRYIGKVSSIFKKKYISNFITILSKRAQNENFDNEKDGTTLRSMIVTIVRYIFMKSNPNANDQIRVREWLNDPQNGYNFYKNYIPNHHIASFWIRQIKHYKRRSLFFLDDDERKHLEQFCQARNEDFDQLMNYDMAVFFAALNEIFLRNQTPSDLPPKYIFSYIDNIYTVTSECSVHGENQTTTYELSQEGWDALLNAMLQILQWLAQKYFNKPMAS